MAPNGPYKPRTSEEVVEALFRERSACRFSPYAEFPFLQGGPQEAPAHLRK